MIKLQPVEPTTPSWTAWKAKCEAETLKLMEEFKDGKTSTTSELYKKEKNAFAAMYNGKCVWCEKRITSTQFGDIDHFRPKRAVAEEDWTKVQYSRNGRSGDHAGYTWLACSPSNLIFSCVLCNQVATGREWGKGIRFPVVDFRAEEPGEEAQERPVLLHPCTEDPAEHIAVDQTGVFSVRNQSEKGRATIAIFGLNKRGLPEERAKAFEDTVMRIDRLWSLRNQLGIDETMRRFRQLRDQSQEFSAVIQAAFRKAGEEFRIMAEAATA